MRRSIVRWLAAASFLVACGHAAQNGDAPCPPGGGGSPPPPSGPSASPSPAAPDAGLPPGFLPGVPPGSHWIFDSAWHIAVTPRGVFATIIERKGTPLQTPELWFAPRGDPGAAHLVAQGNFNILGSIVAHDDTVYAPMWTSTHGIEDLVAIRADGAQTTIAHDVGDVLAVDDGALYWVAAEEHVDASIAKSAIVRAPFGSTSATVVAQAVRPFALGVVGGDVNWSEIAGWDPAVPELPTGSHVYGVPSNGGPSDAALVYTSQTTDAVSGFGLIAGNILFHLSTSGFFGQIISTSPAGYNFVVAQPWSQEVYVGRSTFACDDKRAYWVDVRTDGVHDPNRVFSWAPGEASPTLEIDGLYPVGQVLLDDANVYVATRSGVLVAPR